MLLFDHWHHRVREQSSQRELLRRRRVAVGVSDSLTVVTPSDPRKTVRGWLPYPDVTRVNVKDMGPMWNDVACVHGNNSHFEIYEHTEHAQVQKSKSANAKPPATLMESPPTGWSFQTSTLFTRPRLQPSTYLLQLVASPFFFFFSSKNKKILRLTLHIKWIIFFY